MGEQKRRIWGVHAIRIWLKSGQAVAGDRLWVDGNRRDRRIQPLLREAKKAGLTVEQCNRRLLDQMTDGGVHQGIVAEAVSGKTIRHFDENWLLDMVEQHQGMPLLLILDGITDPHNLGACLRSAEAAGVDAVVVPKDRSVGITPVVRKVASGAAELVPFVVVTNLSRCLQKLSDLGVWVVGTAGEAEDSLFQADFNASLAVVMGAEGEGLRRLTKAHCSQLVKIPLVGTVSSLNVSVATGVALFEVLRQRSATP